MLPWGAQTLNQGLFCTPPLGVNTQDETASSRSQKQLLLDRKRQFLLSSRAVEMAALPTAEAGIGTGPWTSSTGRSWDGGSDRATRPDISTSVLPALPVGPTSPREPRSTLGSLGYQSEVTGKMGPKHSAPPSPDCAFVCVVTEAGSAPTSAFRDWADCGGSL